MAISTRSNQTEKGALIPDHIAAQLAVITSRLESLTADVEALKTHAGSHGKISSSLVKPDPDEYLCSIKQTGTILEYQHEFVKRSSRVSNWPDNCLLGVFLNGLKEELKAKVRTDSRSQNSF
ncbi:hypothetical protein Hanom_Chr12g01114301 [Helianthus anomalus]